MLFCFSVLFFLFFFYCFGNFFSISKECRNFSFFPKKKTTTTKNKFQKNKKNCTENVKP